MSHLAGDWNRIENMLNPKRLTSIFHRAAARVGNYGAAMIQKGIVSGAPGGYTFTPNSPMTIEKKGSSKPLIDKGDLLGSVTYEVLDNGNGVFIGVKSGKEANIAAVHEFGCMIGVTPKMRAYMHYQGIHLRKSTTHIFIPPRPFLEPVLMGSEFYSKVREIYIEALTGAFL